jgi:peptide-methionine (R)-S-oxide reductase
MPRYRQFIWVVLSAATMAFLTVSMAAAQDPFQVAEKSATEAAGKAADKKDTKKSQPEPEFVRKTLQEWQRTLPRAVFEVTRLKATEAPFSGKYATGHFRGTFVCACCNAELFSSQHKFDSGTGWPSFWRPLDVRAIDRALDSSEAEPRVEVMCHRCGAHLGHVFDDGPPPTGLRFCINSLSLKLNALSGATASPASKSSRAKSKIKTTNAKSKTVSRSSRNKGTATARPDSHDQGDDTSAGSAAPATRKTSGSD